MATSSSDDAVYIGLGKSLLWEFYSTIPRILLYGIYLVVFPGAIAILLRKPFKTKATFGLIGLIILLFFTTTIHLSERVAHMVAQIKGYIASPKVPLESRQDAVSRIIMPFDDLANACGNVNFFVGDTIAAWRAWVLYNHNKPIQRILATVVSINILISLIRIAMDVTSNKSKSTVSSRADADVDDFATFLSFATNLFATILIACRLWSHRYEMSRLGLGKQTGVERILVLLVETGLVFSIMQLINAVCFIALVDLPPNSAGLLAKNIIGDITVYTSAIIPTLIVVIMYSKRASVIDTTLATADTPLPKSALKFASISSPETRDTSQKTEIGDEVIEFKTRSKNLLGNEA